MQYVLDGTQFNLYYWDWTTEDDRDAPFDNDKLGTSSQLDGTVMGELMDHWYTVCTLEKSVCNPKMEKSKGITRCTTESECNPNSQGWPNLESAKKCLGIDQFRRDTTINGGIANKYDKTSFGNYLEGFTIDDFCDDGDTRCDADFISSEEFPRDLHNQVSLIH